MAILAALAAALFFLARYWTLEGRAATLRRAASALAQGRNAEVHHQLKNLLWFCPHDAEALRLSGLASAGKGDYGNAVRDFMKISPESPVAKVSRLELVAVLQADFQMESSETVLRGYLQDFPDSIPAVLRLTGLLRMQLRVAEAVSFVRTFIQHPEFGRHSVSDQLSLLIPLAGLQFDSPQPDAVLPQLLESLKRHPAQPTVMIAVGRAYVRLGRPEQAVPFLQKAQLLTDSAACGSAALAEALILMNDLQAADRVLNCLSEQDGGTLSAEHSELRARWLEAAGQLEDAVLEMNTVVRLNPGQSRLRASLGRLYQRLQRAEEAAAEHQKAHELAQAELALWRDARNFPDNPTAADCRRIVDLYGRLNCPVESEVWQNLATALAKEPSEVRASSDQ